VTLLWAGGEDLLKINVLEGSARLTQRKKDHTVGLWRRLQKRQRGRKKHHLATRREQIPSPIGPKKGTRRRAPCLSLSLTKRPSCAGREKKEGRLKEGGCACQRYHSRNGRKGPSPTPPKGTNTANVNHSLSTGRTSGKSDCKKAFPAVPKRKDHPANEPHKKIRLKEGKAVFALYKTTQRSKGRVRAVAQEKNTV